MKIDIDFFLIAFSLVGIIQGFFLGFVFLFRKKVNKKVNLFLSLTFFFIASNIFPSILIKTKLYLFFPHFTRLGWFFSCNIPILLYFYTKMLISEKPNFSKKDIVHFIPTLVCFLILFPFLIKPASDKIQLSMES